MAKRFTATEKWSDPWFCSLTKDEKLFWLYLLDACNHAGIWDVNWGLVHYQFGGELVWDENKFTKRIVKFADGAKWFLPGFILFQYHGELHPDNRVHASVITVLKKEGLWPLSLSSKKEKTSLPLPPPAPDPSTTHPRVGAEAKDKDKDKALDKVKDKDSVSHAHASISSAPVLDRNSFGVRRGTSGWYKDGWMVECDSCGPIQDETHTRCHYCGHVYDFTKGQNDANHCCKSS